MRSPTRHPHTQGGNKRHRAHRGEGSVEDRCQPARGVRRSLGRHFGFPDLGGCVPRPQQWRRIENFGYYSCPNLADARAERPWCDPLCFCVGVRIVANHDVDFKTNSVANLIQIPQAIEQCLKCHPTTCPGPDTRTSPLRLINVGTDTDHLVRLESIEKASHVYLMQSSAIAGDHPTQFTESRRQKTTLGLECKASVSRISHSPFEKQFSLPARCRSNIFGLTHCASSKTATKSGPGKPNI